MNSHMNRTITRRGFLENAMLAAADDAGDQMLVTILDPSKVHAAEASRGRGRRCEAVVHLWTPMRTKPIPAVERNEQ